MVPREFIPAVEKGLVESMANGVLLQVTQWLTLKLSFTMVHTTMSTHLKLPSRSRLHLPLKEAAKSAQPAILEPMMLVTITVPEENLGDVMGHVTARRGRVDGMEATR